MSRVFRCYSSRLLLSLLLLLCSVNWTQAQQGLPGTVLDALRQYRLPPESLSVFVQDINAQQPLLAANADIPRNPASTIKTLTTFVGLALLGPDYTWKTEAYALGQRHGDSLQGDLLIKGYGDPFLAVDDVWKFSRALRDRGLRQIQGDLLLDDSYFAPLNIDPGAFDNKPYQPYNASPNALLVNFQSIEFLFRPDGKQVAVSANPAPTTLRIVNNLKLSRGKCRSQRIAMTVDTPVNGLSTVTFKGNYPVSCGESSMYRAVVPARPMAAGTFLNLWQNQGGTLSGAIRATAVPADARPLYTQPSRPLAELIRGMNKYSNNVMTRQLFLTLGAERFGPPATLAKSRNTIAEWLTAQGLQMPELVLDNGAGLSRQTRISARSMGRLLIFASHSEYGPEFLASLPLAGIDGTMRRRFRKEDLLGQARFKTGTLNGVRAIAGYLRSRSDRTFAVVMLHNQTGVQNGTGSRVQDALLRWLYEQ